MATRTSSPETSQRRLLYTANTTEQQTVVFCKCTIACNMSTYYCSCMYSLSSAYKNVLSMFIHNNFLKDYIEKLISASLSFKKQQHCGMSDFSKTNSPNAFKKKKSSKKARKKCIDASETDHLCAAAC